MVNKKEILKLFNKNLKLRGKLRAFVIRLIYFRTNSIKRILSGKANINVLRFPIMTYKSDLPLYHQIRRFSRKYFIKKFTLQNQIKLNPRTNI